jgi:hypothetical protein
MSGEKKIIKINPALFHIGKSGGNKNKTEKKRPIIAPLIQPNSLKNELLRRIKKHKNKEIEKIQEQDKRNKKGGGQESVDIGKYTDEFNDSLEYLNMLSSEKKLTSSYQNIPVDLGLPEDLKERAISPSRFVANNESRWREKPAMELKYKVDNEVPYGCLKNGYKPTFKTLRNYPAMQNSVQISNPHVQIQTPVQNQTPIQTPVQISNPPIQISNPPIQIQTPVKPSIQIQTPVQTPIQVQTPISEREKRMKVLKDTIQKKKSEMATKVIPPAMPPPMPIVETMSMSSPIQESKPEEEPSGVNLIKKTIRRKYTVGKSKKNNTVGILIKDRNTRKNILNAQRELKKKNINDVKIYLRKHGLLKVGSTAPNDVVRKMYEATMMTGEVHNNNKDVLLHNFMKEGESDTR